MNLVLLHGFCESSEMWDDFIPLLDPGFNLLIPDLPGFGSNAKSFTSLEDMADEVFGQIKAKMIPDQSLVLLGHSMGGYVLLQLLRKYPKVAAGLILFHSTPFPDTEEKKAVRLKSINFVQTHGHEKYIETFVPGLFNVNEKDSGMVQKGKQKIHEIGLKTSPKSIVAALEAMRNRSSSESFIRESTIPKLFIFGKWDDFVNLDRNVDLATSSRNSEICILQKTAHMGMFEEPNAAANAVCRFLKGLG